MLLPATDNLPIRAHLTELLAALEFSGAAVLVSPPGTGKTTLVPLALADRVSGRILVAQPRRVAARAAATRMAALVGEPVGESVGYSVRGDSRKSPRTRVEVVTTGLLLRRIQQDPDLPGVAAVIVDECHERHLDTDLTLAFAADVRANLRPELLLLAMSATTHAEGIAAALGTDTAPAPVVRATGAIHPLEITWCPPPIPVLPSQGTRVDPKLLNHVCAVVRRAVTETTGDVLVFLPGGYEIAAVERQLDLPGVAVQTLQGNLTAAQQDQVLAPSRVRRVVLATAIAESSLTVPGVRVVVDAGLSRVPRADLARGLSALVTVKESKASATQRGGRAGREGPGRVYRCWAESEQEWLPNFPDPESATADLTAFALELACWGNPRGQGLSLLAGPTDAAFELAEQTLRSLGALDAAGRATGRGRTLLGAGVHPRLARALLDGAPLTGADRAAEVVALLSLDGPTTGDDLLAHWRAVRSGRHPGLRAQWRDEVARLSRGRSPGTGRPNTAYGDEQAAGLVVGLAFPERLARRRIGSSRLGSISVGSNRDSNNSAGTTGTGQDRTFLMAGGTAADLPPGTSLGGVEWLAIATADRPPGQRHARVRSAVAIDEELARLAGGSLLVVEPQVQWRGGDVRTAEVERLGAITLVERRLAHPDRAAVTAALRTGLAKDGLDLFRWTAAGTDLRARLAACRHGLGEPWPAVDDEALLATLDVSSARNRADLQRIDLVQALRQLVPWQQSAQLDQLAPERIQVPSGSSIRIDYTDPEAPTLPVKVQEVFGWTDTPTVAGQPLRLHLLTPAGRVAGITSDLRSFWVNGYPGMRADLRGRYPRHPWPEDPATAAPTRKVNPRR